MAIKLGKTKDSRTRKKAVDVEEVELLNQKLSEQTGFGNYLLAKGYSSQTVKRYERDVAMFLQWARDNNVIVESSSYGDVLHYIQTKKQSVTQRTVATHVNSLKHYFAFLAVGDETIDNPTTQIRVKGIKRRTLYDLLTKSELEALYDGFKLLGDDDPNHKQNWFKTAQMTSKRNKVMLGLMVYQGMGTKELSALLVEDVKLREGKVLVRGGRKSNERLLSLEALQIMDMMEYVLKTRQELLALSGKQSDLFFVSSGKGHRLNNSIKKLAEQLNEQNSKVTSINQIRTSVITHWLKIHNLRQVQYMAGHRYVSSTEGYLVNDLEDLQGDIGKYHPLG